MKKLAPRNPLAAPESAPKQFRAAIIGQVLRISRKTVCRRAKRNRWHTKWVGNRMEFHVPADLQADCLKAFHNTTHRGGLANFRIPPARIGEVERANQRFLALCALSTAIKKGGYELALDHVESCFDVNRISIRQWVAAWNKYGLAGLLEHKRGHSGRRPGQGKANR